MTETVNTTEFDMTKYEEGSAFYAENSKLNSKTGVREITKGAFEERMEKVHDLPKDIVKKVQTALDFETTVAATRSLQDLEDKLKEATPEQLADDDFRRSVTTTTRLPTYGGNTEVECRAEKYQPNPLRAQHPDSPAFTISHARFRTTITSKGRIDKNLHDVAAKRVRAMMGIES